MSVCYKSLVRPILKYVSVIWSPFHQSNIHNIEMIQQRAARFVLSNYDRYTSVSSMHPNLGWPTLEQSHNILRTIMLDKIVNNLVDVATNNTLVPSRLQLRGHTKKFSLYRARSVHSCTPFFHIL